MICDATSAGRRCWNPSSRIFSHNSCWFALYRAARPATPPSCSSSTNACLAANSTWVGGVKRNCPTEARFFSCWYRSNDSERELPPHFSRTLRRMSTHAKPGTPSRHLLADVIRTSTRAFSRSKTMPPKEDMASTMNTTSLLALFTALPIAQMSFMIPLLVSQWTTETLVRSGFSCRRVETASGWTCSCSSNSLATCGTPIAAAMRTTRRP
mmetsp:Transcript_29488/g.82366  ORF Transcript_29488/g.82366 Transcript_29488/m.82366 type:complete len:211 (-) Transcript_29488:477-1109(-)